MHDLKLIVLIMLAAALLSGSLIRQKFSNMKVEAQESRHQSQIDYELYAHILKTYVDEKGRVNYAELKDQRQALDRLIEQIEKVDVTTLSPMEQKAFWLNAYNAVTLHVIVNKYPVHSIRSIDFGLVWEVKRLVARQKISLGHIEHKIIRPMGDPRIHFALNCASIGCPKLPPEPFYPHRLEEQLERETIRFMNDPEKVRLDRDKNILYHSALFDWFQEDFLRVSPDILSYIKKYLQGESREYLEQNKITLKVLKYDWGLNKQF